MRRINEFNKRDNESYKMEISDKDYADKNPEELINQLGGYNLSIEEEFLTSTTTTNPSDENFEFDYDPDFEGDTEHPDIEDFTSSGDHSTSSYDGEKERFTKTTTDDSKPQKIVNSVSSTTQSLTNPKARHFSTVSTVSSSGSTKPRRVHGNHTITTTIRNRKSSRQPGNSSTKSRNWTKNQRNSSRFHESQKTSTKDPKNFGIKFPTSESPPKNSESNNFTTKVGASVYFPVGSNLSSATTQSRFPFTTPNRTTMTSSVIFPDATTRRSTRSQNVMTSTSTVRASSRFRSGLVSPTTSKKF